LPIEITIKQLDHSYVLLLNIFEIINKKHFDTNYPCLHLSRQTSFHVHEKLSLSRVMF